jgi:hypothetical protein
VTAANDILDGAERHVRELLSEIATLATVVEDEDKCRSAIVDLLAAAKALECDVSELRALVTEVSS